MTDDRAVRSAYLAQLRRLLPPCEPWERWLQDSGELPPDYDALPACAELPDPLARELGAAAGGHARLGETAEWPARREALLRLFQRWVLGTVPPAPALLHATTLAEQRREGATLREVQLALAPAAGTPPDQQATLWVELMIPAGPGPFPVFMTQHNHRGWALIAVRRGYIGCLYAGSDSRDETDGLAARFPGYDWSRLTRRAWAASRCVDYLATVPEADGSRIVLAGHSRNGKQALIASALDERFAAVISSSSGAGGSMAARFHNERQLAEGIESLTRTFPDWLHPRLRFFAGREDRLPVDFHQLVALSAPRSCLLSTALNDSVESTWGTQRTYDAARDVYRFLDAEERLSLIWRSGGHETAATVIERYLDWCDTQLGRARYALPLRYVYPSRRAEPRAGAGPPAAAVAVSGGDLAAWEHQRRAVRAGVLRLLGDAPPGAGGAEGQRSRPRPHVPALLGRGTAVEGIERDDVPFGEYLDGDVYVAARLREPGHRAPAVIWVHPLSCPLGYVASYRRGDHLHHALARAGFVAFCYDQIGCGRRIEEAELFAARHPHWSLLGKMVRDCRAAVAAACALPYVDPSRVWLLGYDLGALVALHAAALDERVHGLVLAAAPPSLRGSALPHTGTPPHLARDYHLLPQPAAGAGDDQDLPYDVPHLLASVAPRPALVLSPQLDWQAPIERVTAAVATARAVYALYGAAGDLQQLSPEAFAHFGPEHQALAIGWLQQRSAADLSAAS